MLLLGVMCIAGNWISVVFWVCYIELLLLCPQVQFSRNAARDFENYKHYVLRRQCWNRDRNIKRLCTADIYRKRGRPFSLTKGLRSKRYTSLSVYIRSANLHLYLGGGESRWKKSAQLNGAYLKRIVSRIYPFWRNQKSWRLIERRETYKINVACW